MFSCYEKIVNENYFHFQVSGPEVTTETITEVEEPDSDWEIEPTRTPSETFGQCRLPVVPAADPDVSAASGKFFFFQRPFRILLKYRPRCCVRVYVFLITNWCQNFTKIYIKKIGKV